MLEITAGNHPGAIAPPLLIQDGSSGRLPSSDEEGRRARGGGGAEQEMYKLEARGFSPAPEFLQLFTLAYAALKDGATRVALGFGCIDKRYHSWPLEGRG